MTRIGHDDEWPDGPVRRMPVAYIDPVDGPQGERPDDYPGFSGEYGDFTGTITREARPTTAELTEQVMVRMTPELLNRLRERAAAEERTVAQTVRRAIKRYLEAK